MTVDGRAYEEFVEANMRTLSEAYEVVPLRDRRVPFPMAIRVYRDGQQIFVVNMSASTEDEHDMGILRIMVAAIRGMNCDWMVMGLDTAHRGPTGEDVDAMMYLAVDRSGAAFQVIRPYIRLDNAIDWYSRERTAVVMDAPAYDPQIAPEGRLVMAARELFSQGPTSPEVKRTQAEADVWTLQLLRRELRGDGMALFTGVTDEHRAVAAAAHFSDFLAEN